MKANELRIGNWVKYEGRHFQMCVIAQDVPFLDTLEFGDGVVEWKDLEPIPLTEEWLERLGLHKLSDTWEFWKNSEWDLKQHKLESKWWLYNSGGEVDCIRIDYVHSLQNLYFAITGQELELKP